MLRLNHTLLALCFLLLLSCGKKEEGEVKIPEGVLSAEVFTKVLRDFALAESAANANVKGTPYQKSDSVYAFDPLKENNVTQVQYDSTISFYVRHPDLYKQIYEDVLAALSDMQTQKNPALRDSATK